MTRARRANLSTPQGIALHDSDSGSSSNARSQPKHRRNNSLIDETKQSIEVQIGHFWKKPNRYAIYSACSRACLLTSTHAKKNGVCLWVNKEPADCFTVARGCLFDTRAHDTKQKNAHDRCRRKEAQTRSTFHLIDFRCFHSQGVRVCLCAGRFHVPFNAFCSSVHFFATILCASIVRHTTTLVVLHIGEGFFLHSSKYCAEIEIAQR